jgi:hypothetical protein
MVDKCPSCGQPIKSAYKPVAWPKLPPDQVRAIWRSPYRRRYLADQFDITTNHVTAIKVCLSPHIAVLKYASHMT